MYKSWKKIEMGDFFRNLLDDTEMNKIPITPPPPEKIEHRGNFSFQKGFGKQFIPSANKELDVPVIKIFQMKLDIVGNKYFDQVECVYSATPIYQMIDDMVYKYQ